MKYFIRNVLKNELTLFKTYKEKLKPLLKKLNDTHKYEQIIYDSYIENQAFILTDEQRKKAYQSYKESRGES